MVFTVSASTTRRASPCEGSGRAAAPNPSAASSARTKTDTAQRRILRDGIRSKVIVILSLVVLHCNQDRSVVHGHSRSDRSRDAELRRSPRTLPRYCAAPEAPVIGALELYEISIPGDSVNCSETRHHLPRNQLTGEELSARRFTNSRRAGESVSEFSRPSSFGLSPKTQASRGRC